MPFPSVFPSIFPGDSSSQGSYDLSNVGYDDPQYSYDGLSVTTPPPPPPPPTDQLAYVEPFGSKVYIVETRTKDGKRVAVMPYQNLQMEFLLNEPGNCRFQVPINHSVVTRNNIEEIVHEVWVWRTGSASGSPVQLFAGPIWEIDTNSDGSSLQITANGLLSYFKKRLIDVNLVWKTTNTGPGICSYLINWTQTKSFGALNITPYEGGSIAANFPGVSLGYELSYRSWETKVVYDAINDLGDNVSTGFDYEIIPGSRKFRTYTPSKGNTIPGSLRYPVNISNYYMPRFGSRITNDFTIIGPGDGEKTLRGFAKDTNSMAKYGLMESYDSWGDAKSIGSLYSRALKFLAEHKTTTAVPNITLRGDLAPFIFSYAPGDYVRVQIDNGYDQFDKVVRMTGYQLTAGEDDYETINVYLDMDEATI